MGGPLYPVMSGGEGAATLTMRILAGYVAGESLPADKSSLLAKIAFKSSLIRP
jgi:hypothetical protein